MVMNMVEKEITIVDNVYIANVEEGLKEHYLIELLEYSMDYIQEYDPDFIIIKSNYEDPEHYTDIMLEFEARKEIFVYDDYTNKVIYHISI